LPGYFYSTSAEGLYLHLYDNSVLDWHLENGTALKVQQKTSYPWKDVADITITPEKPADFTLYLRIPGWSDHTQVTLNGKAVSGVTPGQYLALRRRWQPGDAVSVKFDLTTHTLEANPRVVDDYGRVAVQRGPLIYCLEQLDQPEGVALADVRLDVNQKSSSQFHEEFRDELFGGIVALQCTGAVDDKPTSRAGLYFRYRPEPSQRNSTTLTFIPYYAWANRAATPMQVWTPVISA